MSYTTSRMSLVDQCESMLRPATSGSAVRGSSNPQTPREHPATARSPYTGSKYSTPTATYSSRPHHGGVDVSNVTQSLLTLQENARTHTVELEMERNRREVAIKELSTRSKNETAELREMIKQLRAENTNMKETMWALERNMRSAPSQFQQQDPRGSYFGSKDHIVHHDEMPLIPRVHDLETTVEKLKRTTDRLIDQERSQEERLEKLHLDMTSFNNQTSEDVRRAVEQQTAHMKDLIEVERDVRLREVEDVRTHLLDTAAELRHEFNTHNDAATRRLRSVEETATQATVANAQVAPALAQLKALIEANEDDNKARIDNGIHQVKQEVEKQARQLREERTDAQKDMQRSVTQQVELATTTLLPRDDFTRFQNQVFTPLCGDVETANKHAQQARVAAENTHRELAGKIASFETSVSDVTMKADHLAQSVKTQEQVGRNNATEIADAKAQMRLLQTAYEGLDVQHTKLASKVAAMEETSTNTINSLGRLKSQVESQHHEDASERGLVRDRLATGEASVQDMRKDMRNTDLEVASVRSIAERALTLTGETSGALHSDRGLGGEAAKKAQTGIESLQRSVNDLKGIQDAMAKEVDGRLEALEGRAATSEGEDKKMSKRIDGLAQTVADNDEAASSKVASLSSASEKAAADIAALTRRAATLDQLKELDGANQEALTELHSKVDKNRKEVATKVDALAVADTELAGRIGRVESAAQTANDRALGAAKDIQKLQEDQEPIKEAVSSIKDRMAGTRKDPATESRLQELEERVDAASNKQAADVLRRRIEEVSGDLSDEIAELKQKQSALEKEVHEVSSDLTCVKDDNALVQDLLSQAASGIQSCSAKSEEIEMALGEVQNAFENHDANFDAIEASLREIKDDINGSFDAMQPLCDARNVVTPECLAGLFSLLAHTASEELARTTNQAGFMRHLAGIVERHEVGFASMDEILEALVFISDNVVTIAGRVGLEQEKFRLRVFEESGLRGVIEKAVAERS